MEKAFEYLEEILVTIWNKLYIYLCETMGVEVNEDLLITDFDIEE